MKPNLNTIFLVLTSLVVLINCSLEVHEKILDTFMEGPSKDLFKVFHFLFKKEYELDSEEGLKKYKVFKKNLKIIKETNSKDLPYKLGVNQFADLTSEEFTQNYLMKEGEFQKTFENSMRNLREEEGYFDKFADLDDKQEDPDDNGIRAYTPIDWTKLFGPIRNQGSCGSCWAYATSGTVEAYLAKKNNQLSSYLSVQQLVDCDLRNWGCNGGDTNYALTYIMKNGLVADSVYPYKGVRGTCSIPNTYRTKISSFTYCMNGSYYYPCKESLIYSRLTNGPQTTAIDGTAIQLYRSGIFTATCSTRNHAIIMVGYDSYVFNGTTYNYWKIRNSWGPYWGESGYIRIYANEANKNSCYVTSQSFSVTP